jgi:glycosyltransferase involved in cell wall biosynthesis
LKILHIIEQIDYKFGGPSFSVPSLAATQSTIGNLVEIIFFTPDHKHYEDPSYQFHSAMYPNLIFSDISYNSISKTTLSPTIISIIQKHIKNSDVIHLHGLWRPILTISALLCLNLKKPYIISPRGMLDSWSLSQKKIKKKIAILLLWKYIFNRAAFVHSLNIYESGIVKKLFPKVKVRISPNGMFKSFFNSPPPSENVFLKQNTKVKNPYILFLGRIHFKKGVDFLAKAFIIFSRHYKNVDLVVAGPDDGELEKLKTIFDIYELRERVHFVGPIYSQDKFSAITCATCFCLPSRQEGFSMAITEALACGTPVVISKQCNFPEVEKYNAGIITNLIPSEISNAFMKIFSDSNQRHRMGEAGRNLIENHYTWEKSADLLTTYYRKAIH